MRPVHISGTSRRLAALLAAVVSSMLLVAGASQAATPRQQLRGLAAAMRKLSPSSVRIQGSSRLTGAHLSGSLKKLRGYSFAATGEVASGPTRGNLSLTIKGHVFQARILEGAIYIEVPSIVAKDNGRPWVSEPITSGALSGEDGGLAEVGLAKTAALLSSARHVRGLGASTLYGQSVRGFAGKMPARAFEREHLTRSVGTAFEHVHGPASVSFQIFIASDGLPVRALYTLRAGAATLHLLADITAIDFPLTVLAPAAGETITAGELEALERDHQFG